MDIHFLIDTFLVPVSLVVGCTILGMVVDRVVVRWLSALAEKTTRQSPGSAIPKCSSFIADPPYRIKPAIRSSSTTASTK